jgi:probable HAF family extracellular repeat protein
MASATLFNAELGINNADTTVGYSSLSKPGLTGQTAYRQSGGVYTSIDALLPANQNSQATGINDAGEIVGFYQPASSSAVGFVDVAGSISTIAPFGSANTRALGVNNAGEIVGVYADATSRQHGYVYHDGVFTAFDPPGSTSTTINGVNDNGVIVGYYSDANSNVIGFVGNPVQLPDPVPSTSAWVLFALSSILALLGLRGGRRRAARAGRLRPGGRLSDGTVRSLHGLPNHSRG